MSESLQIIIHSSLKLYPWNFVKCQLTVFGSAECGVSFCGYSAIRNVSPQLHLKTMIENMPLGNLEC